MQLQRLSDGKRRVVSVSEITGLEGDVAQMQEIFKFVRTGTGENGEVLGTIGRRGCGRSSSPSWWRPASTCRGPISIPPTRL
jgi:hypothetical protein